MCGGSAGVATDHWLVMLAAVRAQTRRRRDGARLLVYPGRVIAIRAAVRTDAPFLLAYVGKKSEFDRATGVFTGVVRTTREKIEATLFGEPRFAHALVAEDAGGPRGFALYYFRYSSFTGQPSLWLDDLDVDADARGRGLAHSEPAALCRSHGPSTVSRYGGLVGCIPGAYKG